MVWPIVISVSVAPGPYFFSASTTPDPPRKAVVTTIGSKRRMANMVSSSYESLERRGDGSGGGRAHSCRRFERGLRLLQPELHSHLAEHRYGGFKVSAWFLSGTSRK